MNESQSACARNIVAGLNYLLLEADNAGLHQIARIIKISAKDVCLALEQQDDTKKNAAICNSELFAAIRFLSQFASMKDSQLKREIIAQIESLRNPIPKEAGDAA